MYTSRERLWRKRSLRTALLLLFIAVVHLLYTSNAHGLSASLAFCHPYAAAPATRRVAGDEPDSMTLLPHIPPKIWQISISPGSTSGTPARVPAHVSEWLSLHPSFAYTIVDNTGALAILSRLQQLLSTSRRRRGCDAPTLDTTAVPSELVPLYDLISRPVMRADFMRYAVLALEGGVYSDSDTYPVRPLREWAPEGTRDGVGLIVGIEADAQPPIAGTFYPVQLGQWTIAGAKGHPVFWRMLRRVLVEVQTRAEAKDDQAVEGQQTMAPSFTNADILKVSGPAGWTEELYGYMSDVTATEVTWQNLTGLRDPTMFGDVLVLPIDGFATGLSHSGASLQNSDATMVRHEFAGSWK
ncbi:hypothetical protein LX36DRAFT_630891 [Colletotrichum falcatum]|nr:hypothetical protein LX36DRAFT_630891 [Colletotrichum falcatum]